MDSAALTLAFTAGGLAALNPCGFALLPAYLTLAVLPDGSAASSAGTTVTVARRSLAAVGRAVVATVLMTAGFVLVFGAFGLVVQPVASGVQEYLPYVTAATGVLLALVGLVLVLGRELRLPVLHLRRAEGHGAVATFGYGVVYAVASLTCTVGPFLAIVVTSLRGDQVLDGLGLFVTYAAGMGAVVGLAAIAVALSSQALLGRLRTAGRWLPRVTGVLLLLVGLYVAWYGGWEVRVLRGGDPADPVVDTALRAQRWLSEQVGALLP
ncbi:cytochrome c biogenesis CcdA family protein [Nocardioides rubriscoriae]|uniref:cytochrome c biogenesis CcdA family protein n=1 Tax=Nocardioides rubriscoriae TaxID=642762 RepID=UPI001B87CD56|nr:cytochrome c biogenesis protein CcdA [Nocardioides rubriscoriae]